MTDDEFQAITAKQDARMFDIRRVEALMSSQHRRLTWLLLAAFVWLALLMAHASYRWWRCAECQRACAVGS